jgi:hypothetical protein
MKNVFILGALIASSFVFGQKIDLKNAQKIKKIEAPAQKKASTPKKNVPVKENKAPVKSSATTKKQFSALPIDIKRGR